MKYLLIALFSFLLVNCKTQHQQTTVSDTSAKDTVPAGTPLDNTYWKLVELMGQPVKSDSQTIHEPHMILQKSDSTVKGNGGCNGFGGKFEWDTPNKIKFSKIVSTMMACDKIQTENEFFHALQMADNYYIVGDTLILNKARMAPLARFNAVYMK